MNQEFLSEDEIKSRHPGTHILVEVLEYDDYLRVKRGVVLKTGASRDEMWRAAAQLPPSSEHRTFAVISTIVEPANFHFFL